MFNHISLVIVLLFIMNGCNSSNQEAAKDKVISVQEEQSEEDLGEPECVYKPDTLWKHTKITLTKYVELVSFQDTSGSFEPCKISSEDGFFIPGIKERLKLTSEQKDSLIRILFNFKSKRQGAIKLETDCYRPRHAILFYTYSNAPVNFIELCFECDNFRVGREQPLDFCSEKMCMLRDFFASAGIKYEINPEFCK